MYIYGTLIQPIILQLSKSMDVDFISSIFLFFLVIHLAFSFFVCVRGLKKKIS